MLSKKKFPPLPRPGRRRSEGPVGPGMDGSERSGPPRARSFGRKPSFPFGRRKSKGALAGAELEGDYCNGSQGIPYSPSVGSDVGSDAFFTGDKGAILPQLPVSLSMHCEPSASIDLAALPTVRTSSRATVASIGSRGDVERVPSQDPILATRSRSLTPSEQHYHTAPSGGCNAPLAPIAQHYQTNDALLELFSTLYEKDQFEVAYAVGLKFVEVALFQIPAHSYYRTSGRKRTKSVADAMDVTRVLGEMVEDADDEGSVGKAAKLQALARAAEKSYAEAVDDESRLGEKTGSEGGGMARALKEYIARMQESAEGSNLCALPDNLCSFWSLDRNGGGRYDVDDEVVAEEDQHAKKRMRVDRESLPPGPEPVVLPQVFIKRDSTCESLESEKQIAAREASSVADDLSVAKMPSWQASPDEKVVLSTKALNESPQSVFTENVQDTLVGHSPTESIPIVTQPDEESGVVIKGARVEQPLMDRDGFGREELQLALSLSLSMQEEVPVVSSSSEDVPSVPASPEPSGHTASLASLYQEQYQTLRQKDKFHVRFLDTFQGRNPNSTNGCTVIAPLMCVQFFTSSEVNDISTHEVWNNGIPDDLINEVIDEHAASVLPEVRGKLSLEDDAFIIPSDVHDHLIEVGLLSTSQFVGVCGGNILDDNHLASLKSSLLLLDDKRERVRLKGRKIGATFFFHGHVVALHVINGNEGDVWIELIDSLPDPDTWVLRPPMVSPDSTDTDERVPEPTIRWSDDADEWETPASIEVDDGLPLNAVRVRCTDIEHFDTLIRHYACSKFSKEEQAFVDSTVWDDTSGYCESSFDPRVFQAFIWCEAE
ncbi:hypothetical protein ACHAXT_013051 [Thalassiosira profunda]